MKTLTTLLIICITGFSTICQAQTDQVKSKADTVKPMNLLDEQVKMYGSVFDLAGAGEDNPLGGSTNYSEALEKMDASEELKEQLREIYELYDASLDPDRKAELKIRINKMLKDAKEKSLIEN